MTKLNAVLKELKETRTLLLDKFKEVDKLKDSNERLRGLNAKLSKKLKILQEDFDKLNQECIRLKDDIQRKSKD